MSPPRLYPVEATERRVEGRGVFDVQGAAPRGESFGELDARHAVGCLLLPSAFDTSRRVRRVERAHFEPVAVHPNHLGRLVELDGDHRRAGEGVALGDDLEAEAIASRSNALGELPFGKRRGLEHAARATRRRAARGRRESEDEGRQEERDGVASHRYGLRPGSWPRANSRS